MRIAAQETAFQVALRNCCEEARRGPRLYRRFATKGQVVWSQKIIVNERKTRYHKWRNLVPFSVWEDARVWTHWNHSFDMHLSQLGPVSCVFTSWVPSGLTVGSGCSLRAARWQVFFVSFLSPLRAHQLTVWGGCNRWWLWHPLFTDTAGNIPFLLCKHLHFCVCKSHSHLFLAYL